MPIEVRELIIKAMVAPEASPGGSGPATQDSNGGNNGGEETVKQSLDKTFEIIKENDER